MIIVVHGGAGKIPPDDQEKRKEVLEEAARIGIKEENPLEAVESAIRRLEDFPLFNAGYGGSFQLDGEVRLDAAIARSDLSAGGVINVENTRHAITLAEAVRKRTPHILLQGQGAQELAEGLDLDLQPDTKSQRAREKWEELTDELSDLSYPEKLKKLKQIANGHDTVGAVAHSEDGKMAAGTSTGGVRTQMRGRVGDSPIIGSGLYCNETGAVSTTGIGEAIIKVNLARELIYRIESGEGVKKAAKEAITKLEESTGSRAGLIALDSEGEVGTAHNTRNMQYAVRRS
ncbi:isoaspartyl peptidase/L-asparaginase [Candidatus Bipolaricaulota bacterium]|nr:isoaspartyl peptidase/L-asparaginase [Candidatus Bipolaricaulota bacterium]